MHLSLRRAVCRHDPRVRNLVGQMHRSVAAAAPQCDEDLRMMGIVGYASKRQPGGGLLVPEGPPTYFQVCFTAISPPGSPRKKMGSLRWLDLLCHHTVLIPAQSLLQAHN